MLARKSKDRELMSTYAMLVSRADNDRLKYGLKSTDELSDSQVLKIISAEVTQLKQELKYAVDKAPVSRSLEVMSRLLPEELSEAEVMSLVNDAVSQLDSSQLTMKDLMAKSRELYSKSLSAKTLPMKTLSTIVKEKLNS